MRSPRSYTTPRDTILGSLACFAEPESKACVLAEALKAADSLSSDRVRARVENLLNASTSHFRLRSIEHLHEILFYVSGTDIYAEYRWLSSYANMTAEMLAIMLRSLRADIPLFARPPTPRLSLTSDRRDELVSEAVAMDDLHLRAIVLGVLAPCALLGEPEVILVPLIETAGRSQRSIALQCLADSVEVIAAFEGDKGLAVVHRAIADVADWYP